MELINFCTTLENVCIETIEQGDMTKDLALCIHGKDLNSSHYMSTDDFMNIIEKNLAKKMEMY